MAFVIELLLIGVGLSMDAFAVAVCKGLAMRKVNKKQAVVIGLFFGGFQALMPFIGWALGTQFESYITRIDHWIAFILLALIGGKMVVEGYRLEEDETVKELDPPLDLKEMFLLAIATSIDALAVGITFAFLNYPIVKCITIIGLTTFVLSIVGVVVGNMFGSRYQKKAEMKCISRLLRVASRRPGGDLRLRICDAPSICQQAAHDRQPQRSWH